MNLRRIPIALAWLLLSAIAANLKADPVYFIGLGDLPGGTFESRAFGISADGTTVVGSSRSATGDQAFRWSLGGGMSGIGFLPGGTTSTAYGVSGNGSVVVGSSASAGGLQAFRWTLATAMSNLGGVSSVARAVSADGQVIVGQSGVGSGSAAAIRWRTGQAPQGLSSPLGAADTNAFATSADGAYTAGAYTTSSSPERSVRWNWQGASSTHELFPGEASGLATAISSDGSVAAGMFQIPATRAFRWASATGQVSLGMPPGITGSSFALGISANGSTIVGGAGATINSANAFVWTSTAGMRRLSDVLTADLGINLTGWTLGPAYGVSADGLTIVGSGVNPSGNTEAWVAHIPEPTTLSHFVLAGIAIVTRRRSPRRIS